MAALATGAAFAAQDDVMDIDIDMDIDDMGPTAEDGMIEEGEDSSFQAQHHDPAGVIPAIYTEDPALEPQWQKIHIKGVDDMHTNDILAFAKDYFPHADPHVQWIDDSSANLVFQDRDTAGQALLAFVQSTTTPDAILNEPFELRQAKQLASRPSSILTIRVAQAGDRKKKNAREASRWYLLHPEDDPGENPRGNRSGRTDNGDYRRRRFDERELRRRRDKDHNGEIEDFSANMYDDAPATDTDKPNRGRDLFARVSKPRRRSASPGGYSYSGSDPDDRPRRRRNGYRDRSNPPPYTRRDPNPHVRNNVGKELFSDSTSASGTLRSDLIDRPMSQPGTSRQSMNAGSNQDNRAHNSAVAKRLKADLLASISNPSGHHPPSPRNGHRRSHAMDAKNDEDLAERFGRKSTSISMDSTKSINAKTANSGIELFPTSGNKGSAGLNIRGAAAESGGLSIKGSANAGISIKGRANSEQVKELFPDQYNRSQSNRGKELFDEPVRERGRRQRAGDLFD